MFGFKILLIYPLIKIYNLNSLYIYFSSEKYQGKTSGLERQLSTEDEEYLAK